MPRYATSGRIMSYNVPRLLQACWPLCQYAVQASSGGTLWHLVVARGSVATLVPIILPVLPGEDTILFTCA